MAKISQKEVYCNAVIDTDGGTISEINEDSMAVYGINELFERWNGIEGLTITIEGSYPLPEWKERDEI